jgi:hypothetical protein
MLGAVLLVGVLAHYGVIAPGTPYVCPREITIAPSVSPLADEWQTLSAEGTNAHRLSGATFASGHPKDRGFLKPYMVGASVASKKGVRQDVYLFSAEYPDGIWLVCRYQDTPAIVFKRLQEMPKTCEISYSGKTGNSSVESIDCR